MTKFWLFLTRCFPRLLRHSRSLVDAFKNSKLFFWAFDRPTFCGGTITRYGNLSCCSMSSVYSSPCYLLPISGTEVELKEVSVDLTQYE